MPAQTLGSALDPEASNQDVPQTLQAQPRHSASNSLATISEQEIQNRLPTLPYDTAPPTSSKTFVRGHRSQRSYSPTRLTSLQTQARPTRYQQPESPIFAPARMSSSLAPTSTRIADYYDDQFKLKNHDSKAKERVLSVTPVIADLRTNVVVKDEYTLITDISNELSARYSRSEASIFINLDHSACVVMGGSFDPAYILTVSACPSFIQPHVNKRNAVLLQQFLHETMGVPPHRGIVRFVAVPEDSLATDSRTVLSDIKAEESNRPFDTASVASSTRPSFFRGMHKPRTRSRHTIGIRSQKSLPAMDSTTSLTPPRSSGLSSNHETTPEVPPLPTAALNTHVTTLPTSSSKTNSYADSGIGTPTTDSHMHGIPASADKKFTFPPAPPVPADSFAHQPKLGKCKSLMNIIRKSKSRTFVTA